MEAGAQVAALVDDMRHQPVHQRAVVHRRELEPVGLGKFARGRRVIGAARQEPPINRIEAVRGAVAAQHLRRVALGVGRDCHELDNVPHRRRVDLLLYVRDLLAEQRTHVRTARVDEVENDDLPAEVLEARPTAVGVLQGEVGRRLVHQLNIGLVGGKLVFQLLQGMRRRRRRQRRREGKATDRARQRSHKVAARHCVAAWAFMRACRSRISGGQVLLM